MHNQMGDSNSETTSESEDETEDESTEDSAENDDTSLSSWFFVLLSVKKCSKVYLNNYYQ